MGRSGLTEVSSAIVQINALHNFVHNILCCRGFSPPSVDTQTLGL
jgi:hypothetical protein